MQIDSFLVWTIVIPDGSRRFATGHDIQKTIVKLMILDTCASKKSPTAELPATLDYQKTLKNQWKLQSGRARVLRLSCPLGSSAVRCECDTSKNHYKTNVFGHMPSHVPRQCVPSVVLVGFLLLSGRMRHLKKTLQNQWKINLSRHESNTVFENV